MTRAPVLDVLLPHPEVPGRPARLAPRDDEAQLVALLDEYSPRAAPLRGAGSARVVRANMIATLDGAATGPDHVTGSINGAADLRVFRSLRALADVVLVGAGTARQERYRELDLPDALVETRRAHGRPAPLELAVVTRSGDVPEELLEGDRPAIVVTAGSCPRLRALQDRLPPDRLVVAGDDAVDLRAALDVLEARSLPSVLAEGGPALLGDLVTGSLVDELCLTWSPALVGGPAPRILAGTPWLAPPRTARLVHLLHADGVLLGRWDLRAAAVLDA
ncbi:dihydrofolate reductase family protein [Cellulomonas sp.]|uniref:dihydrofolate reductase family protein n=1 Tax=Cellulomonas sp. TaxID=40001 RepID=UPI002589C4F2|nr:dihydrofolate reductase family protein [Cellulomonas sp.]MCR6690211.1 dihydrofolate reductase family protein [Cellulomonas sp.]